MLVKGDGMQVVDPDASPLLYYPLMLAYTLSNLVWYLVCRLLLY